MSDETNVTVEVEPFDRVPLLVHFNDATYVPLKPVKVETIITRETRDVARVDKYMRILIVGDERFTLSKNDRTDYEHKFQVVHDDSVKSGFRAVLAQFSVNAGWPNSELFSRVELP